MQPLFEREQRVESLRMQRLEEELAEAKGLLESQSRRQSELEFVNEDLEHRLEAEARERISLESFRERDLRKLEVERARHREEIKEWESRSDEEAKRRSILEERLRRVEKELYRMHQKKYEIKKLVREELKSDSRHEAAVAKSIRVDLSRKQKCNMAKGHEFSAGELGSVKRQGNGKIFRYSNPNQIKPSTIRMGQVCQAAMDFFGVCP